MTSRPKPKPTTKKATRTAAAKRRTVAARKGARKAARDVETRRPPVAKQITVEQIHELVEWAFEEGRAANGHSGRATVNGLHLHEKLTSIGVDCTEKMAYNFRDAVITPGLEMLRAAKTLSEDVRAFAESGQDIARGTNTLIQQALYQRVSALMEEGNNIGNAKVRDELLELHRIVKDGIKASNESRVTDARVEQLTEELRVIKEENEKRKAALDNLTSPKAKGMTTEARNAIRRELGLADVPETPTTIVVK